MQTSYSYTIEGQHSVPPIQSQFSVDELRNDRKYYIWRFHVEKWALIFAWIHIIFAVMEIVAVILVREYRGFASAVIMLVLNVLVIVAQRNRQPGLYLPYLILCGVGLFAGVLIFVVASLALLYVLGAMIFSYEQMFGGKFEGTDMLLLYAAVLSLFAIALLIQAFIYHVNLMAWRYLREEKKINSTISAIAAKYTGCGA